MATIYSLEERIKELEAEIEQWKTWGIVEIAVRNPSVSEYMSHWEGRATKTEEALSRKEYYDSMRSREIDMAQIPESQKRFVSALLNQRDDSYRKMEEAKQENDKLCWSPITPENMPSIDDEIGRRHEHGFWQVSSDWWSMEFERYRAGGWTHFRSINDPKEATDGTKP
jgi:hypothetical protein